jgi:hypothetical protein
MVRRVERGVTHSNIVAKLVGIDRCRACNRRIYFAVHRDVDRVHVTMNDVMVG